MQKEAGPRPEERLQMQRIANKPKTLRALTNPITGAPPRIDDPVWNPQRVQAISTAAQLSPALVKYLPSAIKNFLSKPAKLGLQYTHHGTPYMRIGTRLDKLMDLAGEAPLIPVGSTFGLGGGAVHLAKNESDKHKLSRAQRMMDAQDIISGKNVRPALWNTTSVDK